MCLVSSMGSEVFLALHLQIKALSQTRSGLGSAFREAAGPDPLISLFSFNLDKRQHVCKNSLRRQPCTCQILCCDKSYAELLRC